MKMYFVKVTHNFCIQDGIQYTVGFNFPLDTL